MITIIISYLTSVFRLYVIIVGITEHDWAKLRDYNFKLAVAEKSSLMKRITQLQCTKCPEFNEHVRFPITSSQMTPPIPLH